MSDKFLSSLRESGSPPDWYHRAAVHPSVELSDGQECVEYIRRAKDRRTTAVLAALVGLEFGSVLAGRVDIAFPDRFWRPIDDSAQLVYMWWSSKGNQPALAAVNDAVGEVEQLISTLDRSDKSGYSLQLAISALASTALSGLGKTRRPLDVAGDACYELHSLASEYSFERTGDPYKAIAEFFHHWLARLESEYL